MSDYYDKVKSVANDLIIILNSQYELSVKFIQSKGTKLLRPNFEADWLEYNSNLFYEDEKHVLQGIVHDYAHFIERDRCMPIISSDDLLAVAKRSDEARVCRLFMDLHDHLIALRDGWRDDDLRHSLYGDGDYDTKYDGVIKDTITQIAIATAYNSPADLWLKSHLLQLEKSIHWWACGGHTAEWFHIGDEISQRFKLGRHVVPYGLDEEAEYDEVF